MDDSRDFFANIDIDSNHFEQIYPNLVNISENQYYSSDRFNSVFDVDCVNDLSIICLNIRSMKRNEIILLLIYHY